jgi:hypothetical protein
LAIDPFSHLSQNPVPKTTMELDNQNVCERKKTCYNGCSEEVVVTDVTSELWLG